MKFEGDQNINISSVSASRQQEDQQEQPGGANIEATSEEDDEEQPPSKQTSKRKTLAGMVKDQKVEMIKSLYKEGEVLYTYNDLLGGITSGIKKNSTIRYTNGNKKEVKK